MEDKIKSGIIHCANYVCNGCPYDYIRHSATDGMNSSAAGYVRCMQKLMEDIYENIKAVENATDITHGRWEQHPKYDDYEWCSACHDCFVAKGWEQKSKLYYCPNCGAKMDKEN